MSKEKPQPIINNAKANNLYREGVKAYLDNEPRDTNPYQALTYKYSEWDRGWFRAFMKGKPIG